MGVYLDDFYWSGTRVLVVLVVPVVLVLVFLVLLFFLVLFVLLVVPLFPNDCRTVFLPWHCLPW